MISQAESAHFYFSKEISIQHCQKPTYLLQARISHIPKIVSCNSTPVPRTQGPCSILPVWQVKGLSHYIPHLLISDTTNCKVILLCRERAKIQNLFVAMIFWLNRQTVSGPKIQGPKAKVQMNKSQMILRNTSAANTTASRILGPLPTPRSSGWCTTNFTKKSC